MADSRIKKVTIESTDLPGVNSENQYLVRFRVVSEDKNRTSHWSPIYKVNAVPVSTVDGDVSISGRFIVVVWDDSLNRPKYDIFIKFDDNEYVYHGTSSTHTYSMINIAESTVQVAVQIEGYEKIRSEALTIYESGTVSLV